MAHENKEIAEIVKKCKILLLDIEGTTTSISFVKDKLFPYAEEHVKQYLDSQWETEEVKEAASALRKLAAEDQEKSVEGVVTIPGEDASKDEQIEGLVKSVKWLMSSDRKAGPLKQLQGLIWKKGYDNGEIKGHVYDDVSPALEQWRSVEGQKVYIYSSGSVDAQKLLFKQSLAGDLLRFIDGHFDTAVGAKQEAASYTNIVEKIGCKADEILFLTDIVKEASAARAAGLRAALVHREGNAPLAAAAADAFAVLRTLAQLTASNKRKPDDVSQDAVPTKVAKTDIEKDVKTVVAEAAAKEAVEKVAPKVTEPESEEKKTEAAKTEKMEVEEPATVKEPEKEDKVEDVPMDGPTVEEVTDAKDVENVPTSETKPIITEEKDKTEEKETEKMDAEVVEPEETKPNGVEKEKNGDVNAPVAEETSPAVEIEEVSDKQDLADVGEMSEDIEPVVEEPPAVEDMEDLQNVGEVLEKECDEILSKVQDVTNLDNIPQKPLLKPIAEETMETENSDTNDIVDRILDSEQELEMKQCEDIDLNSVQEITEPKEDAVAEKSEKVKNGDSAMEVAPKENSNEVANENNVSNGNGSSSPTETETKSVDAKSEEKKEEKKSGETKSQESKIEDVKMEEVKTDEKKKETPEVKESKVEEKKEEESMTVDKVVTEVKETPKVDSKEEKPTPGKEEKSIPVKEEKSTPVIEEKSTPVKEGTVEKKENDKVPEVKDVEVKESEVKEPQVNGKATNGDAEKMNVNGDSSKAEELSSRLSVEENGKKVNGSNGDAVKEAGQGDSKAEAGAPEIKVKTVADVAAAGDEPRTDPIEQPTEA